MTPEKNEGSECALGRSMLVDGNVSFSGALTVDGTIHGDVQATGDNSSLIVSGTGCVHGQIDVSKVVVSGQVTGTIRARDRVELRPECKVTGDIHYGSIEIQLGAIIAGRLIHEDSDGSSNVVALKPTTNFVD